MNQENLDTGNKQNGGGCGFCRRNRESANVYLSHRVRDSENKVTCPYLYRYVCSLCGGTGPNAHTRSYCPNLKGMMSRSSPAAAIPDGNGRATENGVNRPANHHHNNNRQSNSQKSTSVASDACDEPWQLGVNRAFSNMGRISNSRYNSAGRLRNPPTRGRGANGRR